MNDVQTYATEEELLAALRAGDRQACAELVRRYSPKLYRVTLRILGSEDEAEEALQEAFISACNKISSFRGDSQLGTWLYRITTNAALMRLRKRREEHISLDAPVETEEGTVLPRNLADWRFDPYRVVLSGELREILEDAIQRLPDTLRVVFILRELEGLSTLETAEALGISESATKVRLHRARMMLRNLLAPYLAEMDAGKEHPVPA
ncbi:MAG: sigma-70 family RNA polymerase sigma factor [Chloroflexi bacterium]|nr:sigma-70 family RNA polymerase sigma factor [Chloroflexota bacterium]